MSTVSAEHAPAPTELPGLVRSFVAYFTRYIEEQNVSVWCTLVCVGACVHAARLVRRGDRHVL